MECLPDDRATHALQILADRHGLLPLDDAGYGEWPTVFRLLRRLGRLPVDSHPWLPFGTLGPLLIMAHYNPAASDLWGVPRRFRIEVVIRSETYNALHAQCLTACPRLSLRRQNDLESYGLEPFPDGPQDIRQTFHWFMRNYPHRADDRETILTTVAPLLERPSLSSVDLDKCIPHLGVALKRMATGCLAFNPLHAPALRHATRASLAILEHHNVFPLFESARARYWLAAGNVDLAALEHAWQSTCSAAVDEIVTVLADAQAIREKIHWQREMGGSHPHIKSMHGVPAFRVWHPDD